MPSLSLHSSRRRKLLVAVLAVAAIVAGAATRPWSAADERDVAVIAGTAPDSAAHEPPIGETTVVTAAAPTTTTVAPAASDPPVVAARRRPPPDTTSTTGPTATTLPPTSTTRPAPETTTTTGIAPRQEPPSLRGSIVYSSDVDRLPGPGEEDIWIMDPDGRNQRRFVTFPGVDLYPDLSPDGRQVVWANCSRAHVPNCWSIVVADSDGTNLRNLVAAPGAAQVPRFSPDGKRILFRAPADGSGSTFAPTTIFTMNGDGTDIRPVPGAAELRPWTAEWSADGAHILIDSQAPDGPPGSRWEITLADGRRRLVASSGAPALSPEGTRIAYGAEQSLWVADADGTNPRRLTDPGEFCGDLDWAPDSALIVFRCNDPGPQGADDIWVATADGATVRNLTATPGNYERSPSF